VVLAGGTGSRFWPLSTPEKPKQLLPLVTEKPLLHDAVSRLRPIVDPEHTIVLTNASLTKAIADCFRSFHRKTSSRSRSQPALRPRSPGRRSPLSAEMDETP